MNFFLAFRNNTMLALDTIRAHKTRSLLTMLGVIIGTGTIIGEMLTVTETKSETSTERADILDSDFYGRRGLVEEGVTMFSTKSPSAELSSVSWT